MKITKLKPGSTCETVCTVLLVLFLVLLGLAQDVTAWAESQVLATVSSVRTKIYPQVLGKVNFAVAGDVIPHQAVKQAAVSQNRFIELSAYRYPLSNVLTAGELKAKTSINNEGWDDLFSQVDRVFVGADFGVVNLETPVAPKNSRGAQPFLFDAPVAMLAALRSSGINVVNFANNHVFDQRHSGFAETISKLQEEKIAFTGAGINRDSVWEPLILEKRGIRVGLLGMTRWLDGNRNPEKSELPHVAHVLYSDQTDPRAWSESEALQKLKVARQKCDLLVVIIHWGAEYAVAPNPRDVEFAHQMLEQGVEAVIGHHPHVLQGIETYRTRDERNTIIFHSLGNFLSNQSRNYVGGLTPDRTGDPRDSLIIKFSAIKKDYGPLGTRVELSDVGVIPVWTENNSLDLKNGKAKHLVIYPFLIDQELALLNREIKILESGLEKLLSEDKSRLIQLVNRRSLLEKRREIILSRIGDEYLVSP